MTTIKLLRDPELDLHEADILAELPSLSGWAPVPPSPLAREVLDELPAFAGIRGSRV